MNCTKNYAYFCYDGDIQNRDGKFYVDRWVQDAVKDEILFFEAGELLLATPNGNVRVRVGDYVVTDHACLYHYTPRNFHKSFTPQYTPDFSPESIVTYLLTTSVQQVARNIENYNPNRYDNSSNFMNTYLFSLGVVAGTICEMNGLDFDKMYEEFVGKTE